MGTANQEDDYNAQEWESGGVSEEQLEYLKEQYEKEAYQSKKNVFY